MRGLSILLHQPVDEQAATGLASVRLVASMADQAASYNKVAHVHAGIGGWITTSPLLPAAMVLGIRTWPPVETKARSLPLRFSAALHETSRLPGPESHLVTLFRLCLALPGHPVMRVRTSCITR